MSDSDEDCNIYTGAVTNFLNKLDKNFPSVNTTQRSFSPISCPEATDSPLFSPSVPSLQPVVDVVDLCNDVSSPLVPETPRGRRNTRTKKRTCGRSEDQLTTLPGVQVNDEYVTGVPNVNRDISLSTQSAAPRGRKNARGRRTQGRSEIPVVAPPASDQNAMNALNVNIDVSSPVPPAAHRGGRSARGRTQTLRRSQRLLISPPMTMSSTNQHNIDNQNANNVSSQSAASTSMRNARGRTSSRSTRGRRGRNRGSQRVADSVIDLTETQPLIDSVENTSRTTHSNNGDIQQPITSIDLIDSEDENKECETSLNKEDNSNTNKEYDVNDDDVNYEMVVRVNWKNLNWDRFVIRKYQKFQFIFEHYSKKANVSIDHIYIAQDTNIILQSDTPESLNLPQTSFLEGGILPEKMTYIPVRNKPEGMLELKVQKKGDKEPMTFHIKPSDNMHILMIKCAETLQLPLKNLKFYFDGQLIQKKDTPEALDMEGGERIDLHVGS